MVGVGGYCWWVDCGGEQVGFGQLGVECYYFVGVVDDGGDDLVG